MQNIILIIIRALGSLGEQGAHFVLNWIEQVVINSPNLVDNELLYKAHKYICSWQPKNPPVEQPKEK